MFNKDQLKNEAKKVLENIAGVEEFDGYDTYYDEDNVPLMDVLKYDESTVLWFHETNNKYELKRKINGDLNELLHD